MWKRLVVFLRSRLSRRAFLVGVLLLLIVLLAGGAMAVYQYPDGRPAKLSARFFPYPAAFVGGNTVLAAAVFTQEGYTSVYGEKTNQVIPEASTIRADILSHLIEVELVRMELARQRIRVGSDEINASFEAIAAQNGGREQIVSTLRELYGMSESAFRRLIANQLVIEKLQEEVLLAVSVRHILINDQNRASEVARQAREGTDFATLAKEVSEDTGSRDAGGSLGFITRGQTVKPFEEVAFSLEIGEISDPVQSEFGWHIILVEARRGTIDKSYSGWLADAKSNTKILTLLAR
jgi:hypothetical protein